MLGIELGATGSGSKYPNQWLGPPPILDILFYLIETNISIFLLVATNGARQKPI